MIKLRKLLPVFILSTALSISACSGGETSNNQQVTNVENNNSTSESTNSAHDKAIKARGGKKENYDQLAEQFLLEVNDTRELFGILGNAYDVYIPSNRCYDYWQMGGKYTLSKEEKNDCQKWVEEVTDLYASYDFVTQSDTFKSELFWGTIETYAKEKYKEEYLQATKNKTVTPNCPTRPQKNYRTPELIEDGYKRPNCMKYEKG